MKTSPYFLCGIAISWLAGTASAAPDPGNAPALIDAFLSEAAPQTPDYRTDFRPAQSSSEVAPGRYLATGPLAGSFTFRPKTNNELSAGDRTAVYRDPHFRAFLIRARKKSDDAVGFSDRPTAIVHIAVGAAEMLLARPGCIALPCP